jgi:hypothetical protein
MEWGDRGGKELRMRATRSMVTAVLAISGAGNTGCSLLYTKGPQPELHPPPACTTSNDAPITDTVFAVLSVGAVTGGLIAYKNGNLGTGLLGAGGAILGGVGTLVFTPSAVIGYNRTAACRAWVEGGSKAVPATPARAGQSPGYWLLVPAPECSSRGDAPLLCARAPSEKTPNLE